MRFYFVRHGESEANVIQQISNREYIHGLTEKGRDQAAILAEKLRGSGGARIYTSPLRRAVETAQILSAMLEVPYEITDALREFDCGIAEGGADERSWDLWQWVWDEWHIHGRLDSKIEGGESYLELQARLYPFVHSLAAAEHQCNAILIGHGGLFSAVLPGLMVNQEQIRRQKDNLGFANTAYVVAEACPEGFVCREWCGVKIKEAYMAD